MIVNLICAIVMALATYSSSVTADYQAVELNWFMQMFMIEHLCKLFEILLAMDFRPAFIQ